MQPLCGQDRYKVGWRSVGLRLSRVKRLPKENLALGKLELVHSPTKRAFPCLLQHGGVLPESPMLEFRHR